MDQQTTAPATAPTILELASNEAARKEVYCNIIINIIKQQALIIGPSLAVEQAKMVNGLQFDSATMTCTFTGNGPQIVDALIEKYRDFFGHAAVEVCREAAAKYLVHIPSEQTPSLLRT